MALETHIDVALARVLRATTTRQLFGDTLVVVARRYPCGGCSEKLRCGCLENVSVGVARVDTVVVARRNCVAVVWRM